MKVFVSQVADLKQNLMGTEGYLFLQIVFYIFRGLQISYLFSDQGLDKTEVYSSFRDNSSVSHEKTIVR